VIAPPGHRWPLRILAASLLLLSASVRPASADWYLTPFAAMKFGGSTTLIDLENVAGGELDPDARRAKKWTWGVTGTWLGTGLLGLEGEFAVIPGYFQTDPPPNPQQVLSSRVTTAVVNVVFAAPLDLTRDSLRPYVSGGFGLMRASTEQAAADLSYTRNLSAAHVGGGVIGMLSRRTGVRWDLRYQRGIGSAEGGGSIGGPARLSFWRASMGVVIRY
jgi:hypothetical protein